MERDLKEKAAHELALFLAKEQFKHQSENPPLRGEVNFTPEYLYELYETAFTRIMNA